MLDTYYIWTIGCQMNKADSERLGSALEQLGLQAVDTARKADVIVLNSCVVRQGAENKVVGNLWMVNPLKKKQPDRVLALMGCMVGPRTDELEKRFPDVDLFMQPQQFEPLLELVGQRKGLDWEGCVGSLAPTHPDVTCYVPIIHGCDLMCTFCIIPYRRGRQVSRPVDEVVREVELLVNRGVREVTVLGQTVDAYGYDLPEKPDLSQLLTCLNDIDGLDRIRFLTSHPSYMDERIIRSVSELPKVCEHINLPVQAGDDEVLRNMRRPYTRDEYRDLVGRIRDTIPGVSMSTDIIVGFPGETEEQFGRTMDLVSELRFDKVHCAAYSTRPGTTAHRTMEDDVAAEVKDRRMKELDALQENILRETNAELVGQTVEVLVEGRKRGKWQGRTRTDKLVFLTEDDESGCSSDLAGQLVQVGIEHASPWALQGKVHLPVGLNQAANTE
ncbi:MAG: tRNA (N6-isopentenyl adenosine(37)-C2)-methylthiotransferase MiaB [Chloroflexota bacterium]|nr:tRNA (N6-isopentenyl adenosine(37)-C2)-methylthiotransferase MiaB [Chloroflexota bacterium]